MREHSLLYSLRSRQECSPKRGGPGRAGERQGRDRRAKWTRICFLGACTSFRVTARADIYRGIRLKIQISFLTRALSLVELGCPCRDAVRNFRPSWPRIVKNAFKILLQFPLHLPSRALLFILFRSLARLARSFTPPYFHFLPCDRFSSRYGDRPDERHVFETRT